MNEVIFDLSNKLNESLKNDPRVIKLNALEEELNNSYEVYLLSSKKDESLDIYINLKEIYGEKDKEVIKALKVLSENKKALDNHPLVKSYLKAYSEVRDLYMEIDHILFSDFKGRKC